MLDWIATDLNRRCRAVNDSFVQIDLGEAGALYVRPLGNDRFAHVYVTTDPDGGGPIGQTNAIRVRGVAYHVSAHPEVNEDGKTIAEWERWPDGSIRHERIHVSRAGPSGRDSVSVATHDEVRALIERACAEYLARFEAVAEIREARADHLRERIERLEEEVNAAVDELSRFRASLEAKRAELKAVE
jgi:hypothetical protein